MKARFTILSGILAVMIAVAVLRIGFAHRLADGSVSTRSRCRANLVSIEYVKSTWASEHHKTTNDTPSDADIYRVFSKQPTCPEGGSYSIGRVGQLPTCSLPEHSFSFPLTESYE